MSEEIKEVEETEENTEKDGRIPKQFSMYDEDIRMLKALCVQPNGKRTSGSATVRQMIREKYALRFPGETT